MGKCTGNTDNTEDMGCASGDGTTATNTQNKGSSVAGTTPADCCAAPTVTGKCTGSTDNTEDVSCAGGDGTTATNTQNKGSSVAGTTPADCCEAPPADPTTTPKPKDDHKDHDHSPSPATVDAASTMTPASLVTVASILIAYMMH